MIQLKDSSSLSYPYRISVHGLIDLSASNVENQLSLKTSHGEKDTERNVIFVTQLLSPQEMEGVFCDFFVKLIRN